MTTLWICCELQYTIAELLVTSATAHAGPIGTRLPFWNVYVADTVCAAAARPLAMFPARTGALVARHGLATRDVRAHLPEQVAGAGAGSGGVLPAHLELVPPPGLHRRTR